MYFGNQWTTAQIYGSQIIWYSLFSEKSVLCCSHNTSTETWVVRNSGLFLFLRGDIVHTFTMFSKARWIDVMWPANLSFLLKGDNSTESHPHNSIIWCPETPTHFESMCSKHSAAQFLWQRVHLFWNAVREYEYSGPSSTHAVLPCTHLHISECL